jgi:hypothetical protein
VDSQSHAPAALPPEKRPVPILQETRWVLGPAWTGAENLDRTVQPVASLLYRLSYSGPIQKIRTYGNWKSVSNFFLLLLIIFMCDIKGYFEHVLMIHKGIESTYYNTPNGMQDKLSK